MDTIDRRTVFAAASAQQASGGSAEAMLRELEIELPKIPAPGKLSTIPVF
jgi:hypothetical protein